MSAIGGQSGHQDLTLPAVRLISHRPTVTANRFNLVKSGRSVSANSRIGNVGRSVAATLAFDRRGLRLRWREAIRCAVALYVDVDGLCR